MLDINKKLFVIFYSFWEIFDASFTDLHADAESLRRVTVCGALLGDVLLIGGAAVLVGGAGRLLANVRSLEVDVRGRNLVVDLFEEKQLLPYQRRVVALLMAVLHLRDGSRQHRVDGSEKTFLRKRKILRTVTSQGIVHALLASCMRNWLGAEMFRSWVRIRSNHSYMRSC